MKINHIAAFVAIPLIIWLFSGCEEQAARPKKSTIENELGITIGEITDIFSSEPIPVEGYALVGGLGGNGSSQCPIQIRSYLQQYILKQLPGEKNADKFIDSLDTAVVIVYGTIPALASLGDRFDVKAAALAGTQTRSLEGGFLWGCELKARGRFGTSSKVLATAEGPVYIDKIDDAGASKQEGFILGGARVLDDYPINMVIRQPSYRNSAQIRNRIVERFGYESAKAILPGQIELRVPAKYRRQKQKFISLVKATYLNENPAINQKRVDKLIANFVNSDNKDISELSLEALGAPGAEKLVQLLKSPEEEVRLRAGRCLLNIGDDRGLQPLREMVLNKNSNKRADALEAIAAGASRNNVISICQMLVRDENFDIKLAAYERLLTFDDIAVTRERIGRSFYLDTVPSAAHQSIFVSRSGVPRIILFGNPIYCRPETFIRSEDGGITIDAPLDSPRVKLIRKVTDVPLITVESSYKLSDIIKSLCEEAMVKDEPARKPGLNVPYSEMIAFVQKMCDKGALLADFKAGPLPKID